MRSSVNLVLYLVTKELLCSSANITSDEDRLFNKIMKNYNRATRPVYNASDAVNLEVSVSLIHIDDMEETNQVLRSYVWLHLRWRDEFLNWDPEDFNGITYFHIPSDKVWLPDLVLLNGANGAETAKIHGNVEINSYGVVRWVQPLKLHSLCDMDISNFPFDVQECVLKFSSWTYNGLKVKLSMDPDVASDSNDFFVANSEWEKEGFKAKLNWYKYACCPEVYYDITAKVTIRRKPLYYFYTIIFPCVWLTILNLLMFLLPADSGDKISLGVTVFLTFAVFILVISEKVPVTSLTVPLIGVYLTVTMGMTVLSLFMTVFTLNLHHVGPHRQGVPRWLQFITYNFLSCILCMKPRTSPFHRHLANKADVCVENQNEDDHGSGNGNDNAPFSNSFAVKPTKEDYRQKIIDEWKFVALVFDRILFWIFLVGNAVSPIAILGMGKRLTIKYI